MRTRSVLLSTLALAMLPACGEEEARISAFAMLPAPLAIEMLTLTVRDGSRIIEWRSADFTPRPADALLATPERRIRLTGPDLQVSFRLEAGGEVLSSGTVVLPRRPDWRWNVRIFSAPADFEPECIECEGARAFLIPEAYQVPEGEVLLLIWGGNSIDDPVIF